MHFIVFSFSLRLFLSPSLLRSLVFLPTLDTSDLTNDAVNIFRRLIAKVEKYNFKIFPVSRTQRMTYDDGNDDRWERTRCRRKKN